MDINEKALRMLKHMRRQLWMQGSRDVSVHNAAISIGVKPEESEFDGLLEELLRGGYIEPYPSPSLTAHGLYRLNDSGIAAADAVDNPASLRKAPLRKAPKSPRQADS
jgi:hypothetical protein